MAKENEMGKKPRIGYFAGIKRDWVTAAQETKIVKKIFLFIWAFIKLIFKIIGLIFWLIYKICDVCINHPTFGTGPNSMASRAEKRGMKIGEYEAWLKEQKEIHGKE
jgi:hypothetical protein